MLQRTSYVDNIKVKTLFFSSILQIGDSCIINGFNRALAVQREAEMFYGNEGDAELYSTFSEPIPFQPINETFSFQRNNLNPLIKVKNIDIIGLSSASMLHVGNSQHVSMEARIKHIRQLLSIPREEEQGQS